MARTNRQRVNASPVIDVWKSPAVTDISRVRSAMFSDIQFDRSAAHHVRLHLHVRNIRVNMKAMTALDKMSLTELEDLAAKLRHTIARNPGHSRMEQVELEDVKQWIAIHQNRENPSLGPNSN
jgi:hypothetical protein